MDFDGDGKGDLVTGSYNASRGPAAIYWLRGLGEARFAPPAELRDRDGAIISAATASSFVPESVTFRRENATEPWLSDWDGDGDLDLAIGSMEGEIVLVRNDGDAGKAAFATQAELVLHGEGKTRRPIRVHGGEAGPVCADWDSDGVWDLLVGSASGAVYWFRNLGTLSEPVFAEGRVILPAPMPLEFLLPEEQPSRGHSSRLAVVDWDGDGDLDLLVGDAQKIAKLNDPARRREFLEQRQRLRELDRELHAFEQVRGDEMWVAGFRNKTSYAGYYERMEPLLDRESELREILGTMATESTPCGLVWVFLRQ